ncbi:hypothetical protein [Clostridioides difficile]|nr:hypothetical protein [Clostridioides difficile]
MNLDLEFYQKILEASHDEICVSDDKGIIYIVIKHLKKIMV